MIFPIKEKIDLPRLFAVFLSSVFIATQALGFRVDVSESPKSNLALTLQTIASAQKSLFINAYELTSPEVSNAIIKKISDGVRVEVLQEGQPVGGLKATAKEIQNRIVAAMEKASPASQCRYFVMTSKTDKGKRRFRYDHAKYMVVDESFLLVGSENYSPHGNPNSRSTKGTRGWQTFLHDPDTAQDFIKLFQSDTDMKHGDLLQLVDASQFLQRATIPLLQWQEEFRLVPSLENDYSWMLAEPPITLDADLAERLTSPDDSLKGLIAFIQAAKESLDLQLMSFNSEWGKTGEKSPLLLEIIRAARRGVRVRVLLNDGAAFGGEDSSAALQNQETVAALKKAAKKEKLPLQAVIADVKNMGVSYIHNKGALSDGDKTLISSINWNQNSVENNREAALSILSRAIHSHYQSLFDEDWDNSQ